MLFFYLLSKTVLHKLLQKILNQTEKNDVKRMMKLEFSRMMSCQEIVDRTFQPRRALYRNSDPNNSRLRKNYPIEQTKMLARNIRSDFISQEITRTFYLLLQNYQLSSVFFSFLYQQ